MRKITYTWLAFMIGMLQHLVVQKYVSGNIFCKLWIISCETCTKWNNETTNSECSESERENECTTPQKNQVITLKNGLGKMRKRGREAVLQVKIYKLVTESEKYYHSRWILYLPWFSETGLLGNYQMYQHHHNEVIDIIDTMQGSSINTVMNWMRQLNI